MKKIVICLVFLFSLMSGCAKTNQEFVLEEYYSKELENNVIINKVINRFNQEVSSFYKFSEDLEGNVQQSLLYLKDKSSIGTVFVWNHPLTFQNDSITYAYKNDVYEVQGDPIVLMYKNQTYYHSSNLLEFPDYMTKSSDEYSYVNENDLECTVKAHYDLVDSVREENENQIKFSFYYKIMNEYYDHNGEFLYTELSYENTILFIDSNGLLKQITYNSYLDEEFTELDSLNSNVDYYSFINLDNEDTFNEYKLIFENSENKSFAEFKNELEDAGFKFNR